MQGNNHGAHLVVGFGEIGQSMMAVLSPHYEVEGIDIEPKPLKRQKYRYLHVCIPWSGKFVEAVREYVIERMEPYGIVINHSTVPLGTTERLGPNAVHSPVRGVHPNLEGGIRTFVKLFGGPKAKEAAAIFNRIGVTTLVNESSRNTEAMKLWSTTQYGLMIILEKEIHDYCERHNLDFDVVYTKANETYNDGYMKLGMPQVIRPVLKHMPGPVGGHCIIPNTKILDSYIADLIRGVDTERLGGVKSD